MNMAFKFRFVNEITGIFVMLALAALAAGVFFAGRAQGLFEPKFQLQALFTTDEGSFGLKRGAEVRIRDTAASTRSPASSCSRRFCPKAVDRR